MKAETDPTMLNIASQLPPPVRASELASAARTLSVRRARLLDRLDLGEDPALRRELARVELALSWCHAGVYGRCCVCGAPLPSGALESDPADLACDRCHALHGERPRAGTSMRTLSFTDDPAALHDSFVRARAVARMPES